MADGIPLQCNTHTHHNRAMWSDVTSRCSKIPSVKPFTHKEFNEFEIKIFFLVQFLRFGVNHFGGSIWCLGIVNCEQISSSSECILTEYRNRVSWVRGHILTVCSNILSDIQIVSALEFERIVLNGSKHIERLTINRRRRRWQWRRLLSNHTDDAVA